MKKRNKVFSLLAGVGAVSSVGLMYCDNLDIGRVGDDPGPIMVTRVTLLDVTSRDTNVFTDTRAPQDCSCDPTKPLPAAPTWLKIVDPNATCVVVDATDPKAAKVGLLNIDDCQKNPMKDAFSATKNMATPDSVGPLRVVFNKLPLLFKGKPILDVVQKDPTLPPTAVNFSDAAMGAINLLCDTAGCGVPALLKDADITGSVESPDPSGNVNGTPITYGPALTLTTDTDTDPTAALEPNATYHVDLDSGLSGRNGTDDVLQQLDASHKAARQTFTTEPFQILQVGSGDAGQGKKDAFVYSAPAAKYTVKAVALNGVVGVHLNAPVDATALKASSITATADGNAVAIKVFFRRLHVTKDKNMVVTKKCAPRDQHTLYIAPAAGTWGKATSVVITMLLGDIRDLSQLAGHPAGKGRNTLDVSLGMAALEIDATVTGMAADKKYVSPIAGAVADATPNQDTVTDDAGCEPTMVTPDMASTDDGGADAGTKDM